MNICQGFKQAISQDFIHESSSPALLIIPIVTFRIFSKIRIDIRNTRCTPVSTMPPVANCRHAVLTYTTVTGRLHHKLQT
jgi:hypothetical protein